MATEELSPGSREASIASPLPALVDPASVQAGDALLYKYRTGGFSATTVCTKSSYTHVGIVGPTEPAAADGRLAVYEMTKDGPRDLRKGDARFAGLAHVLTGFLDESAMRGVAYSNLAALAAGMRHAFRTPALWNKDRHDSTLEGSMCSQFVCISLRKVGRFDSKHKTVEMTPMDVANLPCYITPKLIKLFKAEDDDTLKVSHRAISAMGSIMATINPLMSALARSATCPPDTGSQNRAAELGVGVETQVESSGNSAPAMPAKGSAAFKSLRGQEWVRRPWYEKPLLSFEYNRFRLAGVASGEHLSASPSRGLNQFVSILVRKNDEVKGVIPSGAWIPRFRRPKTSRF
eukprot:jgi/Tetstr1/424470/TSEL_014999.t1